MAPKPILPLIQNVVPKADVSARTSPAGEPEMQVLCFSLPRLCHQAGAEWIVPAPKLRPPLDPMTPSMPPWAGGLTPKHALKVGLAWHGNPAHRNDANRSIAPKTLQPLLELDGVNWVACSVAGEVPEGLRHFHGYLPDMGQSASLAAHLDLVITVDTAWAHLAPSVGTPIQIGERRRTVPAVTHDLGSHPLPHRALHLRVEQHSGVAMAV